MAGAATEVAELKSSALAAQLAAAEAESKALAAQLAVAEASEEEVPLRAVWAAEAATSGQAAAAESVCCKAGI